MIWLGVVTRTDAQGVYVRARTRAGTDELGPLLSLQQHGSVEGPGLQSGGAPVTGSAPVVTRYLNGDTVLVSDVENELSTFVVLGRVA